MSAPATTAHHFSTARFFIHCLGSTYSHLSSEFLRTVEGVVSDDGPSWSNLLDLAVTPEMLRTGLTQVNDAEVAESVLRYYLLKAVRLRQDGPKIEVVASYLCRTLAVESGESRQTQFGSFLFALLGGGQTADEAARAFQTELNKLQSEAEQCESLEVLLSSRLMERGRAAKQANQHLLYQCETLAAVSAYNVALTLHFNRLLAREAEQARKVAARLQAAATAAAGTSFEGDMEALGNSDLLAADSLSRLEKILQRLNPSEGTLAGVLSPANPAGAEASSEPRFTPTTDSAEEDHLRDLMSLLRKHVRSVDPKDAQRVMLNRGEAILLPAEVDAFRADYIHEESFRGSFASLLCQLAVTRIRIEQEFALFMARKDSEYLWQAPAKSLRYLLGAAQRNTAPGVAILKTALNRGLAEKSDALQSILEGLGQLTITVEEELRLKTASTDLTMAGPR